MRYLMIREARLIKKHFGMGLKEYINEMSLGAHTTIPYLPTSLLRRSQRLSVLQVTATFLRYSKYGFGCRLRILGGGTAQ